MIIGLDIGYGYTKLFGISDEGNTRQVMFKTMVAGYVPSSNFGEDVEVVYVNDSPFTVGQEAEKHLLGEFSVTHDFVGTPEYFAIIAYAIKRSAGIPELLVLGLPPALYSKDKVESLIQQFYRMQFKDRNKLLIHMPKQIRYIPQGGGIFFAHYFEKDRGLADKNVAVIDIGFRTMDIVLMAKMKYISEAARSYPIGVKLLYEQVKSLFSKQFGFFISDEIVEKIITNGQFEHFGELYKFDVSEMVNKFYVEQITRVLRDYSQRIRELKYSIDTVIVGGGGVVYAQGIKNAIIVNNPQYANARGYALYGRSLNIR